MMSVPLASKLYFLKIAIGTIVRFLKRHQWSCCVSVSFFTPCGPGAVCYYIYVFYKTAHATHHVNRPQWRNNLKFLVHLIAISKHWFWFTVFLFLLFLQTKPVANRLQHFYNRFMKQNMFKAVATEISTLPLKIIWYRCTHNRRESLICDFRPKGPGVPPAAPLTLRKANKANI